MRLVMVTLALWVAGCVEAADDGLVEKRQLAGAWSLSSDAGAIAEARFVFDESYLLLFDVAPDAPWEPHEPYLAALLGWRIGEHVEAEGDGCGGPAIAACVLLEVGDTHWYDRSLMSVAWGQTFVFEDGGLPSQSLEISLAERVDPVAAGAYDGDDLRAFEVPARFEDGSVTYRLERLE